MPLTKPIYISAAHKSSGKTTLTIGISAALNEKDFKVQVFKKGPDYIDPLWHSQASGQNCYNLDFNTMSIEEIERSYYNKVKHSDINIIEGNKGLYDGINVDGSNSNAALSKLLDASVILVLDSQGITRGIAPLVLGYQAFDTEVNIAGIILNKVGGARHEGKLCNVLEQYTDIPVIGAVHKHKQLLIEEAHLGLIPGNEDSQAHKKISDFNHIISQSIDLDKLISIGQEPALTKTTFCKVKQTSNTQAEQLSSIKIAIIKDAAFGFYYAADIEALETLGVELIYCSALNDKKLPDNIDALFIGGGFPERHMQKLSENHSFKQHLLQLIESGLPCYAECGGLMYLCKQIQWQDKQAEMVGIISADVKMEKKPQGRGLVEFSETENMLWADEMIGNESNGHKSSNYISTDYKSTGKKNIAAHEFHFSRLINMSSKIKYAYKIHRGHGVDGKNDGIVYKNLLASYVHLQDTNQNHWATRFVQFIQKLKQK